MRTSQVGVDPVSVELMCGPGLGLQFAWLQMKQPSGGGVPHQAQRCRDSHKGQGRRAEGLGFLSTTSNLFPQQDWKSLLVIIKSNGLPNNRLQAGVTP